MEKITVAGVIYEVIDQQTAEQRERAGYKNIARLMRENKQTRQMILKRPAGAKLYMCNEFSGVLGVSYSKPISF